MTSRRALLLSCCAGYTALSFELLWYRAYSIALMARPQAFGVLLGGYLLGISAGAWLVHRRCSRRTDRSAAITALPWSLLAASVGGALLVPAFSWLVSVSQHWELAVMLLAIASTGLGAVLPLIADASIASSDAVGVRTSRVYAANILGSVCGTLVTSLVLMDRWGMADLLSGTTTAEIGLTVLAFGLAPPRRRFVGLAAAGCLGLAVWGLKPWLYAQVFERLFFRREFAAAKVFSERVENRSGVIGVTPDGAVYGSGVYDGMFNVSLHRVAENYIQRPFAVAAFHPAPREVLMIGLSSGSWAAVIANHPSVTHVTIVEINPGYLQLLPLHDSARGLLTDPKVHVEIDDGRHWLRRHPDRRFDLIVSNTTYHWRADASNLLSVEFMALVRQHLREGGVYFYNATRSPRAEKTGAIVFPFAWRLYNMMAVSDRPLQPDLNRLDRLMREYRIYGTAALDPNSADDERLRHLVIEDIRHDLEPRERILARTVGLSPITDDNMGNEWQLPARYRPTAWSGRPQ